MLFGMKWKALLLLGVFVINLISFPFTAHVQVYGVETAKAADTSSLNTFGKDGQSFKQFDIKAQAQKEKQINKNKTNWDLVAILVSDDIANNKTIYDGLKSQHNPGVLQDMINDAKQKYRLLTANTLMDRIERYAKDIQGISEGTKGKMYTKTLIIKVKKNEDPEKIRATLEKLYFNGDGTPGEKNSLKGIVLVGDIPLPVVNKNGNHFISMFPYTDFVDPYYIFDEKSGEFIINPKVQNPAVEVWHGVIKPPISGDAGNKLLAKYFDKNHLYKIGDKKYADFNKKFFYSDLTTEFNLMAPSGLGKYFNYLKYWDDISYVRYNKHWLQTLEKASNTTNDTTVSDAVKKMINHTCPGDCGTKVPYGALDSDGDGYPDGYEEDYGTLNIHSPLFLLVVIAFSMKHANDSPINKLKAWKSFVKGPLWTMTPTDPKNYEDSPRIKFIILTPLPIPISIPRIFPQPHASDWLSQQDAADGNLAGKIDKERHYIKIGPQQQKGKGKALENGLPDIRTKQIIESYFSKYNELFGKFFGQINGWVQATGRWNTNTVDANGHPTSDLVTLPGLIADKDEYTRIYLKAVNDAVEKRIDNYAETLQQNINLVKGSQITGYAILNNNNGVFANGQKIVINPVSFINFGYKNNIFYAQVDATLAKVAGIINDPVKIQKLKEKLLKQVQGPVTASTPVYINGLPFDNVNSIQDCTLYRGSNGGDNSQMVEGNTLNDPTSTLVPKPAPKMPKSWNSLSTNITVGTKGNKYKGLFYKWGHSHISGIYDRYDWNQDSLKLNKPFAGCFGVNAAHPERCFSYLAYRYLFSYGGMREVKNVPNNATTHQACFDMKEKNGFDAYSLKVYEYLKDIGNSSTQAEKSKFENEMPDPASAYRTPKNIKLLDFANKPPTKFEMTQGNDTFISPMVLKKISTSSLKNFSVNFEEVLKNYLGGDRVDNNGNGQIDEPAEAKISFFALDANGQPNWFQVGEQMLQNKRIDENASINKDKPYKFENLIPGVKELVLRIMPIAGKAVPSIVFHKEPTAETILGQLYKLARDSQGQFILNPPQDWAKKGIFKRETQTDPAGNVSYRQTGIAQSLPIDNPRYVSFRDINGNYQKIVYPDIYNQQLT